VNALFTLDLRTAALLAGVAGSIVALMVLLVGRTLPPRLVPLHGLLSLGMGSYGLAFVMIAFNERLLDWVTPVIANGLLVLSFVLVGVVLRRLLGLPVRWVLAAGLGVVVVCMAQNALLLQHEALLNRRLAIGSLCQLAVTAVIVALPWQVQRDARGLGLWLVVAAFATFGLLVLQRFWSQAFGAQMLDIFDRPAVQSLSYMATVLLPVVAGMGFVQTYSQWAQDEFRRLADTDPLTSSLNRRGVEERAQHLLTMARRTRRPLTLLLLDLDALKAINDSIGHAAGDMALTVLAKELRGMLRSRDLLGRIGGDEFVVLLDGTDLHEAQRFITELKRRLSKRGRFGDYPVSVSVGAAVFVHGDDDFTTLLKRADGAMYAAKHGPADESDSGDDADIDSEAPPQPAF
jgi:diguanylate cyclase (GGDEF)-like protein